MPTSKQAGFGIDISFDSDMLPGGSLEDAIVNQEVMRHISDIADKALSQGLGEYGLQGTQLASDTSVNQRKNKVIISCASPYAVYVEFGTGIVGNQAGSPETPPSGYEPGSGEYEMFTFNWNRLYRSDDSSTYIGWFYPDKDGTIKFTQGQKAKPFMWRAQKIIEGEAERILEKAVDDYFAKRRTYGWRNR